MTWTTLLMTFIFSNSVAANVTSIELTTSESVTSRTALLVRRDNAGHNSTSPSEVILRNLHYYNKQQPPMKDRPTEVRLGVYINSIYSINEQTMDYSVSMYLRQAWRDPRLTFPPLHTKIKEVRLGDDQLIRIWVPDTFFRNEKRATFHDVTVNNRLMRLNATGHIWYVTKISATLSCPMKLHKYPLDTQKCPMMFESFGSTMDTLYFRWIDRPVDIEPNLQLPQFSLRGYTQHDCSQNYTAGAFPCMEIGFILCRDVGYFLIQLYVPSLLIVILSWVSFWINVDASPARVSIGLLTVLTTTTQSTAGVNSSLPRVSYIKAIDVWMSTCLVFVFAALIEYAIVNVLARRRIIRHNVGDITATNRRGPPTNSAVQSSSRRPCLLPGIVGHGHDGVAPAIHIDQVSLNTVDTSAGCGGPTCGRSVLNAEPCSSGAAGNNRVGGAAMGPNRVVTDACRRPRVDLIPFDGKWRARRVDSIARKIFPLAFLLFTIFYWLSYTVFSSSEIDSDGEIPIKTH